MADLYQIIQSGFAFEKTIDGYNKVPPTVISNYYRLARGDATDLYVIKHYSKKRGVAEFARGHVSIVNEIVSYVELLKKQEMLERKLDEAKTAAEKVITTLTKVYQSRDNEYAFVFVPCQDGYIGCGWYDHAATDTKGLQMAAFVIYAYGILNSETDEVFWRVAHKYLPYSSKLPSANEADDVIFGTIEDDVIESNNEAGDNDASAKIISILAKKKVPGK